LLFDLIQRGRAHDLSAVVMLVALLAGWFAPPQHSYHQRWVAMPAASRRSMPLVKWHSGRLSAWIISTYVDRAD